VHCRDRGRAAILPCLIALLSVTPPAHAAEPDAGAVRALKSRIEFVTHMLQDDPGRVVLDHAAALGADDASLRFQYEDGGELTLALDHGSVVVGGRPVGRYTRGGALQIGWRQLVLDASRADTPAALALVRGWHPTGLSRNEEAYLTLMQEKVAVLSAPPQSALPAQDLAPADPGGLVIDLTDLSDPARLAPLLRSAASLTGPALRITVPGGRAHAGEFAVGTGERVHGPILVIRGDAEVFGTVEGNLATVQGNVVVHPGSVVTGDVLAVAGQVRDLGGDIQGQIRTLDSPRSPGPPVDTADPISPLLRLARNASGVAGVFLTLLLVGLGLVLFARQPLEVVSDTVLHSFSRSFLVGLLGQVLILPTFGMLVVGLILTVAGILLVPFAVIVFTLLLVLSVLGGFLAIAHAMGESITRRQLARGASIVSANSYRYVTVGLGAVASLWLAWVLFGWVPLAGTLIFVTAILVSWMLATVGFGAALLSRAGLREHFAGRLIPAESLTDEYLWATPQFGVTAVKRPGRADRTPPPL
jgi:hypothetical protein